jgi:flagellar biosynthesis GTPase FlhF
MQEALALVRQELGSQAAVLHTREVRSRGLARLWGGGELIEVVASDNVSVPGRLPDPVSCTRESVVPQSPAGIDLAEFPPASDSIDNSHRNPCSRVSVYLEQGIRPLISAVGNETPRIASREGAPLLVVCGDQDAGVTAVSWKLAQAMTAQGRRAVWVDADLSTRTEFRPANGNEGALADVLSGRLTVHEVLSLGPDGVQCIRRALGDRPLSLTECHLCCGDTRRRERFTRIREHQTLPTSNAKRGARRSGESCRTTGRGQRLPADGTSLPPVS